jgi:hypothetical protein
LTKETVAGIFREGFANRYEFIEKPGLYRFDFALRKTDWTGVAVRYVAKPDKLEAYIDLSAYTPSLTTRIMFGGLLSIVILSLTTWKEMTADVERFVRENAALMGSSYGQVS